MQKRISIPPPDAFRDYGPSGLFRFFFQLGRWTEESFSSEFQTYTRGTLISSVTVNKWKNHNVIPKRYAGPFFKFIQGAFEPGAAEKWIEAFEIVWATYSARADDMKEDGREDFQNERRPSSIGEQHSLWVNTLYAETLFGEKFSARDLFVPLQFIEKQGRDLTLYDTADLPGLIRAKDAAAANSDLIVVTGEAGAGKSMSALHMAAELSRTEIMPIYLRGKNISDIDIDIHDAGQPVIDSFSARSFIKHFRASSHKAACLILDGVDEIPGTAQDISKFLSDLRLEQNVCRAHGKALNLILFSRPDSVDLIRGARPEHEFRQLEMLGLAGNPKDAAGLNAGQDLRAIWWGKYLAATGENPEQNLPDFLSLDYADFAELGTNPSWAFLICRTAIAAEEDKTLPACEIVNKFTYSQNRNVIYRKIVEYITNGTSSESDRQRLTKSAHEILSDYLSSIKIIDCFIDLIRAQDDAAEFNEALENWADVSRAAKPTPVTADFCRNEVQLIFADLQHLQWDAALAVIKNRLKAGHYAGTGLDAAADILHSASLLFFIWSCFNLARFKISGTPHSFPKDPEAFNVSTIRQIRSAGFLNFQDNSILEPRPGRPSFLTPSLSALHLVEADLSQLSFTVGHLESFSCEKSVFALTHWSHVRLSGSRFEKSAFQQAIFHACRWQETEITACLFQGAKFQSSAVFQCKLAEAFFSQCHFADVDFSATSYENVIFDRCVFTDCSFEPEGADAPIQGVEFRYCTFLSMDKYLENFPAERLIHCVTPSRAELENMSVDKLF